jgi:hypothetical protein
LADTHKTIRELHNTIEKMEEQNYFKRFILNVYFKGSLPAESAVYHQVSF